MKALLLFALLSGNIKFGRSSESYWALVTPRAISLGSSGQWIPWSLLDNDLWQAAGQWRAQMSWLERCYDSPCLLKVWINGG
jgi:hypothetical protein